MSIHTAFTDSLNSTPRQWPKTPSPEPLECLSVQEVDRRVLRQLGHTTIAGLVSLQEGEEVLGTMSYVGYKNPNNKAPAPQPRPLIVATNGGPISAGGWVQHELFSPQAFNYDIIGARQENLHDTYPYRLETDTEPATSYSVLYAADLVYPDPPGVGFGRIAADKPEQYLYSVDHDAEAIAAFTEWYLDEHAHPESPVLLVGCSYSAFRMTSVAHKLLDKSRKLAGLMYVSGAHDYDQLIPPDSEDHSRLLAALHIPSLALTAAYHGRSGHNASFDTGQYFETKNFIWGAYVPAVLEGERLTGREERRLGTLTGLPTEVFAERGYPTIEDTRVRLLGHRILELSGVDARYSFEADAAEVLIDPLLDRLKELRLDWMRRKFAGVKGIADEYVFNRSAYKDWSFAGEYNSRSIGPALLRLVERAPALPIADIRGYYDLLNPAGTQDYFWRQLSHTGGVPMARLSDPFAARMNAGLNRFLIPSGHQPGIDPYSRNIILHMAENMLNSGPGFRS